jgi:hypothetical protein
MSAARQSANVRIRLYVRLQAVDALQSAHKNGLKDGDKSDVGIVIRTPLGLAVFFYRYISASPLIDYV